MMSKKLVGILKGAALDWAVAKCEGLDNTWGKSKLSPYEHYKGYSYSTDWSQGGPIIEREKMDVRSSISEKCWYAHTDASHIVSFGATPLEAAMRCYVVSKLGEEIEIPEELV